MDTLKLQLVGAEKLLETLWDESARPSLRWLRDRQADKTIPFVKLGRRVWFYPEQVRTALESRRTIHARTLPGSRASTLPQ